MTRPRSELESFVLGLVWQLGPVAAYAVRQHMRASPSRQWSASTGAIYPALRRLEGEGLVEGREREQGRRRRREYRITDAGLRALRAWVGPPMAPEVVTVPHDPLRSRARFLAALDPPSRRAWIDAARRALDEVEERVKAWETLAPADPFAGAMTSYGRLETEARRRWLEQIERLLDDGP